MKEKERFSVSGSVPLLKALIEELADFGIEPVSPALGKTLQTSPGITVGTMEHERNLIFSSLYTTDCNIRYALPQHYEEAKQAFIDYYRKDDTLKEFVDGEWYTARSSPELVYRYSKHGPCEGISEGFLDTDGRLTVLQNWRKATDEEIKHALQAMARLKGFKEGTRFAPWGANREAIIHECPRQMSSNALLVEKGDSGNWTIDTADRKGQGLIYFDGNWAEILPDAPEIVINGHKSSFSEDSVTFGCTTLYRKEVLELADFILEWNKRNAANANLRINQLVSENGTTLKLTDLNKMYKYFKK